MYRCTAPKADKKTYYLVAALYISAGVLFVLGAYVPAYAFVPQILGTLALSFAVFFSAKKLLLSYEYAVEDNGSELLFTVTEVQGNRRTVVCRFALDRLRAVDIIDKEHKAPEGKKFYNYLLDIAPERSCLLKFKDGADEILVRIAPDERLIEILKKSLEEENI